MREILFRGKSVDGKVWIYGYYAEKHYPLRKEWRPEYIILSDDKLFYNVIPETIGQYAGEMDINGKKIFEGDLWQRDEFIGEIKFEFGEWQIKTTKDSGSIQYPAFYSQAKYGKIIGNIHDN